VTPVDIVITYHVKRSAAQLDGRLAVTLHVSMRVALVTTSYPESEHDAAGHFVRAEARRLGRAGHDVDVIAPRSGGAFGWPGVAARLREDPRRVGDALLWAREAGAALRRRGPWGRVIAHWALPCAWPIAMDGDAPLEVVSHGGDVRLLCALPAMARGVLVRAIARRAARWRFVSRALLGSLLSALSPMDRARVLACARVEPSPVEIPGAAFAAARRKRAELGDETIAVTVARLVPSKRVDLVIEHAAARGQRLVVVGDGPERGRLEALAQARRVDARFVGKVPRDEALAWIGAADVLLHASRAEGLSTVVREAEELGVPVERL
jgi:teichuronic acid biosynthesis glycosyltransferase TuaC